MSIASSLLWMVTDAKLSIAKAFSPISSMPLPMVRVSIAVPENAFLPIEVTLSGISTLPVSLVQLSNA